MAGKLATSLGVKHRVLAVDWQGSVPGRYRMQKKAREKRYGALLEYCQRSNLGHLMTAHHLDDQIGKLCSFWFRGDWFRDGQGNVLTHPFTLVVVVGSLLAASWF